MRIAAATSFFATFALPPILIILIQVFGIFGNERTIRRDLFDQLSYAIDKNTVLQIRETLRNVRYLSMNKWVETGGFIFLLFVATTLFSVINDSLNQLWNIRRKKNNGIAFLLKHRARSVGMIMVAGLLFVIVLMGDTRVSLLRQQDHELISGLNYFLQRAFYHTLSLLAEITWFVLMFRFLADGRPGWKIAIAGGIFTGLLFTLGRGVMHLLLSFGKVQSIYGASASIVLLMLFIFYSAFIVYYGACFTKMFALHMHQPILPTSHAIKYKLSRVSWEADAGDEPEQETTAPSVPSHSQTGL